MIRSLVMHPSDGSPPIEIGSFSGITFDSYAEPDRVLTRCFEPITIKWRLTGEFAQALWRTFLPLYRHAALRHQLKRKGRPGWKRQRFAPATKWRM